MYPALAEIVHLAWQDNNVLYTYREDDKFFTVWGKETFGPFAQESILEEHFDFDRDDWLYLISKESDDFQSPLADLYLASTAMAECKAYIIFDKWAKGGKAFSYYLGGLHYVQIGNNSYIGDINCDGEIIYLKDGEVKFDY